MRMVSTTLGIAGVRICLRGSYRSIGRAMRRYSPYLVSGRPDLTLEWREGRVPKSSHWPNPSVISGTGGKLVLSRRDFFGEISGRKGSFSSQPKLLALDSFLRVLMTEILADRGGILVHSVAIGNRLFPGRSDAGKTTLASLAPKAKVLSDEIVAVVPNRTRYQLCSTPFWGSFRRGTNTERNFLRSLFFLHRKRMERVDRIDAAEAAVRLLECVLCFRDDHERASQILGMAGKITRAVPAFTLSYNARISDYRTVESRLKSAETTT